MKLDLHRRIADLAAGQHGLITRSQLHDAGATAADIPRLVRRGALQQQTSVVFAVAGTPETWIQRLQCALLSIGGEVRAARRTAAALLRFDGFDRTGVIEVVVPRSQRVPASRIPKGVVVHTTTTSHPFDRAAIDGIPVTSASRTIIDLASDGLDDTSLARAIDSAVRDGMTSPSFLARRLDDVRGRGRYGSPVITALLPDSGGHSYLERAFLRLVRRAGLPRPTCQRIFTRDGTFVARTDFVFPRPEAVVEVTGRLGHASDLDRQRDARRRNELTHMGVKVFEFTYNDVMHDPEYVVSSLRERLGLAA